MGSNAGRIDLGYTVLLSKSYSEPTIPCMLYINYAAMDLLCEIFMLFYVQYLC